MDDQLGFESLPFPKESWTMEFESFDTKAPEEWQSETPGSQQRIRWIQNSLNKILGLRLAVDGTMGPRTRSAIRRFQQSSRLTVDGIVGTKTERALRAALGPSIAPPAPSEYVPSPTRLKFENAVASGDWREAFRDLNGLNMYEMLRAIDKLSTESRNRMLSQRANFLGMVNMPRIDFATTVVQTRQLPTAAPGDLAVTGQVQTAAEFLQGRTTDWASVSSSERAVYVMRRLIQNYGFPANGAAGLVGNLWAESGLLPNRIEESAESTPMKAPDFSGKRRTFTAPEIMARDFQRRQGPRSPGIGLAQWTSSSRRSGLFQHSYRGRELGAAILFNMDAQIDYLVKELKDRGYHQVYNLLMSSQATVDAASDEVVYNFERPGAITTLDPISKRRNPRPRTDPQVQAVFSERRKYARRALSLYLN